jgi:hypothetical protein
MFPEDCNVIFYCLIGMKREIMGWLEFFNFHPSSSLFQPSGKEMERKMTLKRKLQNYPSFSHPLYQTNMVKSTNLLYHPNLFHPPKAKSL